MKIKTTYVGNLNGINGFWCGFLPEGVNVSEKRQVLFSEDGYDLIRIADDENIGSSIWLKDGDVMENYREEKQEEEPDDTI